MPVIVPQVLGHVAYRRTGNACGSSVGEVIEPIAQGANQATSHRLWQPVFCLHHCERKASACHRAEDHCLIPVNMNDGNVMLLEYSG